MCRRSREVRFGEQRREAQGPAIGVSVFHLHQPAVDLSLCIERETRVLAEWRLLRSAASGCSLHLCRGCAPSSTTDTPTTTFRFRSQRLVSIRPPASPRPISATRLRCLHPLLGALSIEFQRQNPPEGRLGNRICTAQDHRHEPSRQVRRQCPPRAEVPSRLRRDPLLGVFSSAR